MRVPRPAALAALAATLALASPARADEAALQQRLDALAAELKAVQQELARLKHESAPRTAATGAPAAGVAPAPVVASPAATTFPQIGPDTVLTSYGEIAYSRPKDATDQTTADVTRFVLGFQHRFGERTKVVAELEVEHAVSSADDSGEVAVEQMYVEHALTDTTSGKAGLFLIPSGLLNENHEPTAYYGVFRNFVETSIIPTTWREVGIGATWHGPSGLTLDAGVTTGFDLSKWDPNSPEGLESPLGSIHQEGSLAKARNLSVYGAANWRGVPGLLVGASVFYGGAGQGQDFAGRDAKVTLWETHARWTPGPFDLSALYARGAISNTSALNATFAGAPTPVPSVFEGWYAQAAWRAWSTGDYALAPFARFEQFNTAKAYEGLPQGVGPSPTSDTRVTTLGLSAFVTPYVVLKTDYQWFRGDDALSDRFNLGLGYSF